MPATRAQAVTAVGLAVKPVGKPDAGNPHVRFDERGRETERCRMAQATAPVLDSTGEGPQAPRAGGYRRAGAAALRPSGRHSGPRRGRPSPEGRPPLLAL